MHGVKFIFRQPIPHMLSALIFVFMTTGCVSTRPPADNTALGKQSAPLRIAIIIQGNDKEAAKIITEELYRRLSYFREITPVELEKRIKIDSGYGQGESEFSPEKAIEIGEKFNVDAIFTGDFTLLMRTLPPSTSKSEYWGGSVSKGNVWEFTISIKLMNAMDYKTLWSADSTHRSTADLPSSNAISMGLNPVSESMRKKWK